MALLTSVLINPHTCAVRRIETGLFVGKKRGQGTFQEWPSDARYVRHHQRSPRVVRFDEIAAAEKALQVREDELLAEGFVRVDEDTDLSVLLAHHDPWKTWLHAQQSVRPLLELWKGLAPEPMLARCPAKVTSVTGEAIVLSTEAGELTCRRPLDPEELSALPAFLMPLLLRHASLSGVVDLAWEAVERSLAMRIDDADFEFDEENGLLIQTLLTRGSNQAIPATAGTLLNAILSPLTMTTR
ncbi:MAG: hypothetical protein JNM17_25425 [Archangium sp.]|nr:hypothetical protein [Archangium sp.]